MNRKIPLLAALLAAFAAPVAQAHYLWSENTATGNIVYFGGVDEGVREHSPGRLDEFTGLKLQVQRLDKGQVNLEERAASKTAEGFRAGAALGANASLIGVETSTPVKDLSAYKLGVLKLNFYLRHQQIDRVFPAALKLDAVATGEPSQLQLSFDSKALPNQKAKLVAPNGWITELKSDANGRVTLATPWRGNYVLEVTYFENTSGDVEGQHFERIRHRLALTVVQPKGIATFTPDYHHHNHDH